MNGESVKLSVVIPVYNEEENLGPLLDESFHGGRDAADVTQQPQCEVDRVGHEVAQ